MCITKTHSEINKKLRVASANQALATRQLLCDTFKKDIFQENSV